MVRAYAATYGQVNFYCRDPRHTSPRTTVGWCTLADFVDLAQRVGPILVFLVAITVVAELADGIGLFAIIARWAAVVGRGSVLGLWLLVVLVATLATAVLSLDTTAVLLTPVVLVLARRLGLGQELFAFTAVWLANTASLVLPVSNLTNLLAYARLRPAGVAFTPLMWAPALAVWLVTVRAARRWCSGVGCADATRCRPPFPVEDRVAADRRRRGLRRPRPRLRARGRRDRGRRGRRPRAGRRLPGPTAPAAAAGGCCPGRWCSASACCSCWWRSRTRTG